MRVLSKQYKEDHSSVSIGEADKVLKEPDKRVAGDVRWIYMGDDLDGCDATVDGAKDGEREKRESTLQELQRAKSN